MTGWLHGLDAGELAARTGLAEVRVFAVAGSTNDVAAELADAGRLRLPGAVVAAMQSAGRGRGANTWHSDAGSLTATWAFALDRAPGPPELPLRAGLAVRSALAAWLPAARLTVKWPNDVLVDGRKVAGILCRRTRTAELVGIGLNVMTDMAAAGEAVRARACSVAECLPAGIGAPSVADAFAAVSRALLAELSPVGESDPADRERAVDDWHTRINACHALSGRRVTVDVGGGATVTGRCGGVDRQGRLVLDDGGTEHRLLNGIIVRGE